MVVAPAPAFADPDDAASAAKAVDRASAVLENATAKARVAALRLQAATHAMADAAMKVATSRGVLAAATTAANTAGRQANAARLAYTKVAGHYQRAQGQFEDARDRVDQIAQATYMGSAFSRINVIIEANGPADMMDRLCMVDQLMRTQQQEVDRLIRTRRAARSAQDQAGLAKRRAEDAEALAQGTLLAANDAQNAALSAKQALAKLVRIRQAALRLANAQRSAVLARYRAAVAEEQRIRAALRGWSARSRDGRYGGGQLLMPVHGWKSSDFGERYDPYYRVWQLHAGTDFAAPRGTPIRAAASGHVIRAGWSDGYGKYTCIDHGRIHGVPFETCYGHQSAILVRVGEYVRRGEEIGRVGTTGASTGNHLHFETRFNGVPKNPLRYLPICLC